MRDERGLYFLAHIDLSREHLPVLSFTYVLTRIGPPGPVPGLRAGLTIPGVDLLTHISLGL